MMNKLFTVLIFVSIFTQACKKTTNDPVWDKSYGSGKAMFIKAASDSGLVSCGESGGKPYLIKLDKKKNKIIEYKSDKDGLFSSAWFTKDIIIAAGNSEGKMLIAAIDNQGVLLWDTTFSSDYSINISTVCYLGNNELVAIGSASPDSLNAGASGLYFAWFDTAGIITDNGELKESSFIAANSALADNSGNIFLAFTRKSEGSKSKAIVAKYNSQLQKIWETELYNNPGFGASSLGISVDNTGNIYVSGETELPVGSGTSFNSFAASLSSNGTVRWRKYPENTNSGSSIKTDENGDVFMLNYNCFIISILNSDDGTSAGTVRTFDVCDSQNTKAFGHDFDFNYDGNLIIAGSKGGYFYLAMKPPVPQVTN
jgi:hypothetical protein